MASSAPQGSATAAQNTKKQLGFLANAMKRKDSFIQLFAMTGILLLSIRSVGQKYRIHDLQEDTSALKQEQETLTDRMKHIKSSLLQEEVMQLFHPRLTTVSTSIIPMTVSQGKISSAIWNLTSLVELDLSINPFFLTLLKQLEGGILRSLGSLCKFR